MFAKILLIAASVLVFWSVTPHSSGAHGNKQTYRVQPYDTLWTIAQTRYSGDVSSAVWQIEQANHLSGADIRPGQILLLP